MHRRDFIKGVAAAPFCFGPDAWAAISDEGPRRLIVILLRGAVDGLNVVIPYADAAYYQERQSIAIAPPGKPDGALALDGHFGLAPGAREPDAAMDRTQARLCPRRGFARPDAIAFRRTALSRKRHPGAGHHPRRLDEPPAAGAARSARCDRRDQHRPDRAAHSGGQGARRHAAARPERRPAVADRSAGNRQCLRSALFRQ